MLCPKLWPSHIFVTFKLLTNNSRWKNWQLWSTIKTTTRGRESDVLHVMKMPARRLYVGGLSKKVDRQEIGTKFSPYGTVTNVDLKEKADLDGNVIFKFAYVNLEGDSSQIEKCIKQLNGTSWLGSHLKVEPAKESFLDRLKRERASQPASQVRRDEPSISVPAKSGETKLEDVAWKKKNGQLNNKESHVKDSAKEINVDDRRKKRSQENSSAADTDSSTTHLTKKKKRNNVEEEILSSFKNFSSVWADSEEDEPSRTPKERKSHVTRESGSDSTSVDKKKRSAFSKTSTVQSKVSLSDVVDNGGESDATVDDDDNPIPTFGDLRDEQKAQLDILAKLDGSTTTKSVSGENSTTNRIRRYDPTRIDLEQNKAKSMTENEEVHSVEMPTGKDKFVQVAKDLKFGQGTSNFSLLAQFSQQREKEEEFVKENEVSVRPLPTPKSFTQTERRVKSRPFFVAADDPLIDDAITWMAQSLTEEVKNEFMEVQPQLRELYKSRAARVLREMRESHGQRRGRGRGRGKGRASGVRGKVIFSKDSWWRESSKKV